MAAKASTASSRMRSKRPSATSTRRKTTRTKPIGSGASRAYPIPTSVRQKDEYKKSSDDLDFANKKLEQTNKDLEVRGNLVSGVIYNLEKCIDYRWAVMSASASAIGRVRNENDPPEIVPLTRQLRDMWETGKPGHEEQITARRNALDTCKNSRS